MSRVNDGPRPQVAPSATTPSQAAPAPQSPAPAAPEAAPEETGWLAKIGTPREGVEWLGGAVSKAYTTLKQTHVTDLKMIGPLAKFACGLGLVTEIPEAISGAGETVKTVRDAVRKGELSQAREAVVEFGRDGLRVVHCTAENVGIALHAGTAAANFIRSTDMGAQLVASTGRAVTRAAHLPGVTAAEAVLKTVSGPIGRAAARFAPGLNIAMAGIDTAFAYQTVNDPKASLLKKGASLVTAAGSIVAATNIPIVSQLGAAVSMAGFFTANVAS